MTSCVLNNHGFQIDEEPLRAGLSQAVCRGRIEVVSSNPTIILDTAHNVSSINALLTTLNEEVNIPRDRRIVLMAATRGKDVSGMLKQLIDWCGELIITKYQDNPRGMKTARLAQLIQATPTQTPPNVHRADDPQAALLLARELANNDSLICITGSFFLAAEVEPFLRP
jgi:dihydrofolate synthase/folylpolyglutamate synthase